MVEVNFVVEEEEREEREGLEEVAAVGGEFVVEQRRWAVRNLVGCGVGAAVGALH